MCPWLSELLSLEFLFDSLLGMTPASARPEWQIQEQSSL